MNPSAFSSSKLHGSDHHIFSHVEVVGKICLCVLILGSRSEKNRGRVKFGMQKEAIVKISNSPTFSGSSFSSLRRLQSWLKHLFSSFNSTVLYGLFVGRSVTTILLVSEPLINFALQHSCGQYLCFRDGDSAPERLRVPADVWGCCSNVL